MPQNTVPLSAPRTVLAPFTFARILPSPLTSIQKLLKLLTPGTSISAGDLASCLHPVLVLVLAHAEQETRSVLGSTSVAFAGG